MSKMKKYLQELDGLSSESSLDFHLEIKPQKGGDLEEVYSGKAYVNSHGDTIVGFWTSEFGLLRLNGKFDADLWGNTSISFSLSGLLHNQPVTINFTGLSEKRQAQFSGGFNGYLYNNQVALSGSFMWNDIWFQAGKQDGNGDNQPNNDNTPAGGGGTTPPTGGGTTPAAGGGTAGQQNCGRLLWRWQGISVLPSTGKKMHILILRHERCIKYEFLDKDGNSQVPKVEVTLTEDLKKTINQTTVFVYDIPVDNKTKVVEKGSGKTIDRVGELKIITLQGCTKKPTFFQFVKLSGTVIQPNQQPNTIVLENWKTDNSAANLPTQAPDTKVLGDFPGIDGKLWKAKPFPDGTVLNLTWELETFVCCDGTLLGHVKWGLTGSSTFTNGKQTAITIQPKKPTWHDQGALPASPNEANVQCP